MNAKLFDVQLPATIQAQPAERIAVFLRHMDQKVTSPLTIPIYGSVAVTLYLADNASLDYQTNDVDLAIASEDARTFASLVSEVEGATLRVQTHSVERWLVHPDWRENLVNVSELVGTRAIQPLLLHPVDLIITKLLRWEDRDAEDAEQLKERFAIDRDVFLTRLDEALKYINLSDWDSSTLKLALADLEFD